MEDKRDHYIWLKKLKALVYNEFWKEGILCNIQTLWDPKGGFYINGKRKMAIFPKRLAKKFWFLVQMLRFLPKLNGKVVWFLLSTLWPSPYCRTPWLVRLPSTAFKGSFSTFPITLPGGHIEFYDSIQVEDLKIVKGIPLKKLDP